jgi:Fur family transcriptional regulator, ferric uptake regulator
MTHDTLRWEETLWAAGHRVTRQRALILEGVCAGNGHTSFGEIYLRVQREDCSIDRSTVYRALRVFVNLGLVVAADPGDGEIYYEIARQEPHHHLICRGCGEQWEISGAELQGAFDQVADQKGFRVVTDHLVLFGYCQQCMDAAEARLDN